MPNCHTRCNLLLLPLLLGLAGAPGWASTHGGSAKARAGAGMSQLVYPGDQYGDYPAEVAVYQAPTSGVATGTAINGASAGTAAAFSSAGFTATSGGLHLNAVASASGSGSPPNWGAGAGSSAYADGATSDGFTILAPGYAPGTLFTVRASVLLQGSAGAGASIAAGSGSYDALASWQAQVSIWNTSTIYTVTKSSSGVCWSNRSVPDGCGGTGFTTLDLQFTAANGQPTWLSISGQAQAYINIGADSGASVSGNATADLGHTISWGGIGSLQDGDGRTISDFSAYGADGAFDYRQAYVGAVPEPSTWLLMAAGLLVMAWRPRRVPLSRPDRL